jgi:hypothetical protein
VSRCQSAPLAFVLEFLAKKNGILTKKMTNNRVRTCDEGMRSVDGQPRAKSPGFLANFQSVSLSVVSVLSVRRARIGQYALRPTC